MKTIGLVTDSRQKTLTTSDSKLVPWFKKALYTVVAVPWDEHSMDITECDQLIFRSCWNYHTKIQAFYEWLDDVEKNSISTFNPVPVIRWNSDKRYLLELEKDGVPLIKTFLIDEAESVHDIVRANSWNRVVIKPVYGASGSGIKVFDSQALADAYGFVKSRLLDSPLLIQPYIESVDTVGEIKCIFINRVFSHAVWINKTGTTLATDIPGDIILAAKRVLERIDGPLLYARIDGVLEESKFLLMEAELIEPQLYFDLYSPAARRFVEAYQALTTL